MTEYDQLKYAGVTLKIPDETIQAALAPVARDVEDLRYKLEQAQGYIEWLEGEVDDLGQRVSDAPAPPTLDQEQAKQIAEVARVADKRAWVHVFRTFVMASVMIGLIVGGCFGIALGGVSGGACAMSLMAVLQLMQAMSYRDEAKRADEILNDHGAVRLRDYVVIRWGA